jgi:hypothetical protein
MRNFAVGEHPELWEAFVFMYPEVKDAKDAQAIIEKIKQARAAGLAG